MKTTPPQKQKTKNKKQKTKKIMPDTSAAMIDKINPYMAAASAISNPLIAHLTNVKNRKFAREQYKTQRADALSDWEMQNAYNSPAAQMARFKAAGLNPHLIYGQQNEGGAVRSSSAQSAQATAPEIRNPIPEMINLQRTGAQTDLVGKQMELMKEDIKLRQIQQAAAIAGTGKTSAEILKIMQDVTFRGQLQPFTMAGAAAGVNKTLADTKYTLDENIRKQELHQGNLTQQQQHLKRGLLEIAGQQAQNARTGAEILEINQKVLLLQKENIIKKLDAELASKGIRPGDPLYARKLQQLYNDLKEGMEKEASDWDSILKGRNPNSKPLPQKSYNKHRQYSATDQ